MAKVSAKRSSGSAQAPTRSPGEVHGPPLGMPGVELRAERRRDDGEVDHVPELVQDDRVALERGGAVEARDVEVDHDALGPRSG